MKKISVIVPVYNTAELLPNCIESILKQTYENIELILVDDGSTDDSFHICKQYADNDDRVVVLHQENAGQGSARNLALNIATGDYIGFVDSDDWIDQDMYEILVRNLEKHGSNVSGCTDYADGDIQASDVVIYEGVALMEQHLLSLPGTGQSPCDKLYKKEVWEGIRFPQTRAYEDCATIYRVLHKAQKLVFQKCAKYHYVKRENSTMTQSFSKIKFQAVYAYKKMYDDYMAWYPELGPKTKALLLGSIMYCVGETYKQNKVNELEEYVNDVCALAKGLSGVGLSFKHKMLLMLLKSNIQLFGFMYSITR